MIRYLQRCLLLGLEYGSTLLLEETYDDNRDSICLLDRREKNLQDLEDMETLHAEPAKSRLMREIVTRNAYSGRYHKTGDKTERTQICKT